MDVVVRGKNRPVSKRLREISLEKVGRIARLTHDAGRVEVDFSEVRNPREPNPQECEVTVHLKRHFVKARAASTEPEAALDLVLDKIDHQVARIKEKRVTRSHTRRSRVASSNGHLEPETPVDELLADLDDVPPEEGHRIVKTKRFESKPMPPEEAALQMDLLGHAFFVFTNTETGRAAVLYRRHDGDLGLIETA
jgi:putative sigma-54 modulation protein